MRRRVREWTVEELHKFRADISFPEYQRQDRLWPVEKKRLLIDSILTDIDIPKLYFNHVKGGDYEVVDGQQRLWAIWEFLDNEYPYVSEGKSQTFAELTAEQQKTIRNYTLQVTEFEDADDDYLRELFLRLQLGLLLVTGEKLHASTGAMKDFVFEGLANHQFIIGVKIPKRRFAKETLCAQVAINSFTRAKNGQFSRTRYEDLISFFYEYESPRGADLELFRKQTKTITAVLDGLADSFGDRVGDLTNRSYILSVYLLFEEVRGSLRSRADRGSFAEFVLALWNRLRQEIKAGFDRKNRELYVFETMVSSAPGERYQIERRHQKLLEYFAHFTKTSKIMGDR